MTTKLDLLSPLMNFIFHPKTNRNRIEFNYIFVNKENEAYFFLY